MNQLNFSKMILIKEFLYKKDIDTKVVEQYVVYGANVVSTDVLVDCYGINLDKKVDNHICYTLYPEFIVAEDETRIIANFEYMSLGSLIRKTMILYKS